uniref:Uncharacterized protein n=1 Tax=Cacopsylla melanoneura TaxID=428564 RepID=A0A8D8RTY7_9HEMI
MYEFKIHNLTEEIPYTTADKKQNNQMSNTTSRMTTLIRVLDEHTTAVRTQLNKLVTLPSEGQGIQKRFSVAGWMLMKCCGVATEDQFQQLYQENNRAHILFT